MLETFLDALLLMRQYLSNKILSSAIHLILEMGPLKCINPIKN